MRLPLWAWVSGFKALPEEFSMSKTLVAIVAALAVFGVLYMTMPAGLPGTGSSMQLNGLPPEGNGMAGRFVEFVAEYTWHPLQFSLGLSFIVALSAGMVFYWRSIQD